jgi:hypothetical protein
MSEIFSHKTPSDSTGFLLWKVNNLWQREIRKTLKKLQSDSHPICYFGYNSLVITQKIGFVAS